MKPFSTCEYPLTEPGGPLSRAQLLEEVPNTVKFAANHTRSNYAPGVHLTESAHPAFFQTPLHLHYCPVFYLVLDGSLRQSFGKASRDCCSNDLIYLPRDEPHSEQNHDKGDKGIMIEIVPELVKQSVGWDAVPSYPLVLDRTGFVVASKILVELRQADLYSSSVIQALSVELLVNVCRKSRSDVLGKQAPSWLKRVTDHLAADSEKPSLRELAKEVGVHPVSVARAFRRHHGCTLSEFVRVKKIQAACEKLRHSRLTIGEIAREMGFSDQSHFTRCFRKVMGVSPGTYKRSI